METGATVPDDSGGGAACVGLSDSNSCDWIRDDRSVGKLSICFCMSDSAEFHVTDTGYADCGYRDTSWLRIHWADWTSWRACAVVRALPCWARASLITASSRFWAGTGEGFRSSR